jgi:hypothetical protein
MIFLSQRRRAGRSSASSTASSPPPCSTSPQLRLERGLLGIALHPEFKRNRLVYLYWTESSTGLDSAVLGEVGNPASLFPPGTPQPMGNRVDRFLWDPDTQTLNFDRNIITLRAYQPTPANLRPQS